MDSADFIKHLSHEVVRVPESGIVKTVNYGRNKPGLVPLWMGEGDLVTPDFITEAAKRSLAAGETFYTHQRGIPHLREALAAYHRAHYPWQLKAEDFCITASGMHAISLAVRAVAGAGDSIVVVTPAWTNILAVCHAFGVRPIEAELESEASGGWRFNLEILERAIDKKPRALFINSPTNPSGYTFRESELADILALARARNLWIIADEVYNRFYGSEGGRAPSFYDVATPDDKILFCNTFSKNWAMTGWRVGWIQMPPAIGQVFENLVQYTTSGVPVFVQRAAVAALQEGEPFVAMQQQRVARHAQLFCKALEGVPGVRIRPPDGGVFIFFSLAGERDSQKTALAMVDGANVGLAPGGAFGAAGEGFFRACLARGEADIVEGGRRLGDWLRARMLNVKRL